MWLTDRTSHIDRPLINLSTFLFLTAAVADQSISVPHTASAMLAMWPTMIPRPCRYWRCHGWYFYLSQQTTISTPPPPLSTCLYYFHELPIQKKITQRASATMWTSGFPTASPLVAPLQPFYCKSLVSLHRPPATVSPTKTCHPSWSRWS